MTDIKLTCPNCGSKDEYTLGCIRPCSNDCGAEVVAYATSVSWDNCVWNTPAPDEGMDHPMFQAPPDPIAAPALDTVPPPHYRAKHYAAGVQGGAELIDWIAAMRGPEFAINAMIFEIQTKANRMGLDGRRDKIAEDSFKIRQACRVIERLETHCLERPVGGEG